MSVSLQEVAAPPFEITGSPRAPVVVALGGISASRHVCATPANSAAGWWDAIVGAGKAVDTRRYRVASFDYIDGGRGPDGRPERLVSTRDQADALAAVLDAAGIDRVYAVIGASYGGMVALSFAEHHADRLDQAVVIGAAHQSHPMT